MTEPVRSREEGAAAMYESYCVHSGDQTSPDWGRLTVAQRETWRRVYDIAVTQIIVRCAQIARTPVSGEQDDLTMAAKDRIAVAILALGGVTP